MASINPARKIQDLQFFGEYGGVNPSIEDSSTFTFMAAKSMEDTFDGLGEGCYLYSRHWNPTNHNLASALAKMEGTEAAVVSASGMGAISTAIMQLTVSGDHIVSNRMIYGGTYALMKNFLPRYGVKTTFVDITNLQAVEAAITPQTKVLYTETMSNPLLQVSDIPALAALARKYNLQLVVDNTFTPLIFNPAQLGADVVIHSLTKFINGTSDTIAGVVCGTNDFCNSLMDVNTGAGMLLGPVMDSLRSASVLKNMHSLPVRMIKHSQNAQYLADRLLEAGIKVIYTGHESHPQHDIMVRDSKTEYGFGGMLVVDLEVKEKAYAWMEALQHANVGYLAVSLGFYKTLFSSPGRSTSSEIPEEERDAMGLTEGLVRMSIGLDMDIEETWQRMYACLEQIGALPQLA
jgi:methionine-gamma-lyase